MPSAGAFRDPGRVGRWAQLFLALQSGLAAVSLILARIYGPGFDDEVGGSMPYLVAELAQLIVFVAAAILYLRWVHWTVANAHGFGADRLSVSPLWSILWYFIPIAWLFMPFRSMSETWRASIDPVDWEAVAVPGLLRFWWAAWLLATIAVGISTRLDDTERYPEEQRAAELFVNLGDGLTIVSSLLLIRVISRLGAIQRTQHIAVTMA